MSWPTCSGRYGGRGRGGRSGGRSSSCIIHRTLVLQVPRLLASRAAFTKVEFVNLEIASVHRVGDRPLFLLPSGFPWTTSLSMLSCREIWPKNFRILPNVMDETLCAGRISFKMDTLVLLAVQGTRNILRQTHISNASILFLSPVRITQRHKRKQETHTISHWKMN